MGEGETQHNSSAATLTAGSGRSVPGYELMKVVIELSCEQSRWYVRLETARC